MLSLSRPPRNPVSVDERGEGKTERMTSSGIMAKTILSTDKGKATVSKKSPCLPRGGSVNKTTSTSEARTKHNAILQIPGPVLSPEMPEHGLVTASTQDDLSFTEFSFLDGISDHEQSSLSEHLEGKGDEQPKSCLSTNNLFRRKKKVASTDVASVGNASDTMISVSSRETMSGRDLHEKAKVYFNSGDYEGALPLFEAILSAQVRRFSPLHASVGAAMHNVGVCRQRLGQHSLAENLFLEAVQIRQRTLGPDHLEVAASMSKLGTSRTALRKFDQAHIDLYTALQIARRQLGEQHKIVAQMLCHIGCFYYEIGELFSAQACFQSALEIYRNVWRYEQDRDTCMALLTDSLCNIGSILNRRKRFTDAIVTFSEALDLQRGILGHDDPRVIATLDNLGYSYSKNKDYGHALSCYRTMLRAQISSTGTFTNDCFETFRKQLLMYEKLKQFNEALYEAKETLKLQASLLRPDDVLVIKTKNALEEFSKKGERQGVRLISI